MQSTKFTPKNFSRGIFLLPVMFFLFSENILQYSFPVIVERVVASNFTVGLILGLSSVVGFLCDFLFSNYFRAKGWRFHVFFAATLALFIPTLLVLGASLGSVLLFIIGSIVWGIYYELYSFFVQSYITSEENKSAFSRDWGLVFLVFGFMSIVSPIVSSVLIDSSVFALGSLMIFAYSMAYLSALILSMVKESKKKTYVSSMVEEVSLVKEFKIWEVLNLRLSPIVIMTTSVQVVVATFWTYGALFGESLLTYGYMDFIPLVLFNIPFLLGSILISRLNIQKGKKRISLLCMLIGGFSLFPILFIDNLYVLSFLIFCSGLSLSISSALNEAIYSDLINRAQNFKSDILGLDKSNNSLAFVLGPFLCGFLADRFGYTGMFGLLGIAVSLISLVLLLSIPKKLKLPISALQNIK